MHKRSRPRVGRTLLSAAVDVVFESPPPPNRRVPHPFAPFAKGWDITPPAPRGFAGNQKPETRNQTPGSTVEGHGFSRAVKPYL